MPDGTAKTSKTAKQISAFEVSAVFAVPSLLRTRGGSASCGVL